MILRRQPTTDLQEFDVPEDEYIFETVSIEDLIDSGSLTISRRQYYDLTRDDY